LSLVGHRNFELSLELDGRLRRYYHDTKALLHSIMLRNGCALVDAEFINGEGSPYEEIHFSTAHQVGSCRMAESKGYGVCNGSGEVFGYPGMYVSDGAAIPSSLAVNTALTILANAERTASVLLARYNVGRPTVAAVAGVA
jgi:cholesterol oxidase